MLSKNIKSNIIYIRNEVLKINPDARLIAVSKKHSVEDIIQANLAGQIEFAENYVQELVKKSQLLINFDIIWHFIGKLQSNKIKLIANFASWVHSLENFKQAYLLDQYRSANLAPINVLIEVNISQQFMRGGVSSFLEVLDLANQIKCLPNLKLRGLMGMASNSDDPNIIANQFKQLHQYYLKLQSSGFDVDKLSMGMSRDYQIALLNGSNMLRIGSKIFGERL